MVGTVVNWRAFALGRGKATRLQNSGIAARFSDIFQEKLEILIFKSQF